MGENLNFFSVIFQMGLEFVILLPQDPKILGSQVYATMTGSGFK